MKDIRLKFFGHMRKSRVKTFLWVFLVMLIVSLAFFVSVWIIGSNSKLVNIELSNNLASYGDYYGTGISVSEIPYNNIISDSSFELTSEKKSLVLQAASGNSLYFSGDVIGDYEIPVGSRISVLSLDENGDMSMSYSGVATRFDRAKFGPLSELEDTFGYFVSDKPVYVCRNGNVILALTESGRIITDASSGSQAEVIEDETFIDISESDSGVYALSDTGRIYVSADGRSFSVFSDLSGMNILPKQVKAFGNNVFVILEDNTLRMIYSGEAVYTTLGDLNVMSVLTNSEGMAVISSEGDYYQSSNGMVFALYEEVSEELRTLINDEISVSDAYRYGNTSYLLMSNGSLMIIGTDSFSTIDIEDYGKLGSGSIIVSEGRILVTDKSGTAYLVSSDGSSKIITSEGMLVDDFFGYGEDGILIIRGNSIYSTNLFSELVLDNPVSDGSVLPGDICEIETDISAASGRTNTDTWYISSGSWDIYGSGTVASTVPDAAQGYGEYAARLSAQTDSDDIHMLSQELSYNACDSFVEGEFYRISLNMKQSALENEEVKIWLSGQGIDDIGFVADSLGNKYNEYRYIFVVNDQLAGYEGKLRLNIAFEGQGEIYIDGVYLGRDIGNDGEIVSEYRDGVISASPSIIRFNDLGIGSTDMNDEMLFGTYLENDLRMCKEAGSNPWFVIGSYADEAAVEALIEYLAGSITSEYGLLRTDNGTALPWSRQFTKFYFEINDSEGLFTSDTQRGAFVDYITGLISKTDYYSELKDKVVFIDGMNYEGGTVLSSSDLHSSNHEINIVTNEPIYGTISANYEDFSYSAPRVNATPDSGECISSLSVRGEQLSCGELLSAIYGPSECGIRLTLMDFASDMRPASFVNGNLFDANTLNLISTLSSINGIPAVEMLNPEISNPLSEDTEYRAENLQNDCYIRYGVSGNNGYLIISNCTDREVQFSFSGNGINLNGGTLTRYSDNGDVLQERSLNNRRTRRTLMPGQYMIVRIQD